MKISCKYLSSVYSRVVPVVFFLLSCSAKMQPVAPAAVKAAPVKTASASPAVKKDTVVPLKPNEQFIAGILSNEKALIPIVEKRKFYNLQIVYTEITRNSDNTPSFKTQTFNTEDAQPFYPGTAIKLLVAEAALEKLNKLPGNVNMYTTVLTEKSSPKQTAAFNEPYAPDGKPSLNFYLRKSLSLNDEMATNRLFEFVGQKSMNGFLQQHGLEKTHIWGRLGNFYGTEELRLTNKMKFYDEKNQLIHTKEAETSDIKAEKMLMGNYDFPDHNYVALTDLEKNLRNFLFGATALPASDKNLILKYMSQLPAENLYPVFEAGTVKPYHTKFLHVKQPSADIRYFNTGGEGYGFITDMAYVVDFATGTEFIIGASMDISSFAGRESELDEGRRIFSDICSAFYKHEIKRKKAKSPI